MVVVEKQFRRWSSVDNYRESEVFEGDILVRPGVDDTNIRVRPQALFDAVVLAPVTKRETEVRKRADEGRAEQKAKTRHDHEQ